MAVDSCRFFQQTSPVLGCAKRICFAIFYNFPCFSVTAPRPSEERTLGEDARTVSTVFFLVSGGFLTKKKVIRMTFSYHWSRLRPHRFYSTSPFLPSLPEEWVGFGKNAKWYHFLEIRPGMDTCHLHSSKQIRNRHKRNSDNVLCTRLLESLDICFLLMDMISMI